MRTQTYNAILEDASRVCPDQRLGCSRGQPYRLYRGLDTDVSVARQAAQEQSDKWSIGASMFQMSLEQGLSPLARLASTESPLPPTTGTTISRIVCIVGLACIATPGCDSGSR